MNPTPFTQQKDAYDDSFTELYTEATNFEELNLSMSDDQLDKMLINSLEADRDHWNQSPWNLQDTDTENTAFLFGDQLDERDFIKGDIRYKDNRIFSSVRAILSYATGQLAKPDITPSRGDEIYLKGARDTGSALYQHAADDKVEHKVRAAVLNLISRKRGYLKLRFDPNIGLNGDIVTEVCNPEDIIIDRYAGYLQNPSKIYHRIRCTVDELCARFPEKDEEIKKAFSIRRGVYSQTSKMVTYFECWFTYMEGKEPKEGVCWFIAEKHLILDKIPNPNWVYLKSNKKEKEANVTSIPPKPFVAFNYINTGHSYIDETCLVEQAKPMQIQLNKRLKQIGDNLDYANGRWVYSKKAFSQEDARNLVNKGARTLAGVDREDVNGALANVAPQQFTPQINQTVLFAQNEIDGMMGTPSQFKGAQPDSQDTLGRDLMIKQQAGALQDDLVRCVSLGMEEYYKILLQMMRVYYTDDYWFQTKGGDGKYEFILINSDKIDSNVKVSVQTDSTLPLDKASIRATAMELWKAGNAIAIKDLYEMLGLPNPELLAEHYLEQNTDPAGYLASIKTDEINNEAESDIDLLIANKTPEERDNYDQPYIDYFNKFLASNRFAKIQGEDPQAAQRITMFLVAIQHAMMQSLQLQESIAPPPQPAIDPTTGQPIPPQDPTAGQAIPPQKALPTQPQAPPPNAAPPVPTQ